LTGFFTERRKKGSDSSSVDSVDLYSFGIKEGISETIISTGLESPNAAPIGIIVKNGRTFVRLFKGTHTWENVT